MIFLIGIIDSHQRKPGISHKVIHPRINLHHAASIAAYSFLDFAGRSIGRGRKQLPKLRIGEHKLIDHTNCSAICTQLLHPFFSL